MTWSHRPALDGVRALAVYLVLLFHVGLATFDGGFVGVDLFFVLSGFLVTSVLLSEIDATGSLRLGRFYARRVRRLLPAAVVVVVATGVAFVLFTSIVRRFPLVADARSALLYYANWHFLGQSNDYFAADLQPSPYLHFWSLAIEEQYYVVFPLVLLGLVALSRRRAWALPVGLAVLALVSVASQLYWRSADPNHAYYGTDARLYQLLVGSLLAQVFRAGWSRTRPAWSGLVGLAMMVVVSSALLDVSPTWRGLLATLAAVLLIVGMMGEGPATRLFALPGLVYLGKISYGTYLWHWPVILILREVLDVSPWLLAVLAGVLSTALAALSAEILELPIRRRPGAPRWQWPVAAIGVTVSAITAFVVMPPILHSDRQPALVAGGTGYAGSDRTPVPDLDWDAVAHDFGGAHKCSQPEDCYVVDNGGPTVVLVGDSHGKMVLPMFEELAREKGFTLAVNVADGCPWQAGLSNENRPPDLRQKCIDLRGDWYDDVLPRLHPDLVVLVEQSYDGEAEKYEGTLTRIGGSDETLSELLARTTRETLDTFHDHGIRSLVVKNTIPAEADPLDCLAGATYVSECLVPVPIGVDDSDAAYQAEDVARDDMWSVDLNPVLCPDAPLCRPVLGDTVVWRDHDHLTTKILLRLREQIWQQIVDSGALDGSGLAGTR
ncbi:acyltransferase family protein [Nocardioides sp. URHA0020]|uniref:acyltransferase family protein n=1 Tax=Nocardioides sp. URHA0020 TaxID=1380392 RepID=UPI000B13C8B9|nr:acyltransferase family protein [Nocardioides sp. URHA0020]